MKSLRGALIVCNRAGREMESIFTETAGHEKIIEGGKGWLILLTTYHDRSNLVIEIKFTSVTLLSQVLCMINCNFFFSDNNGCILFICSKLITLPSDIVT